jgi:hypothetical protein
MLDSDLPRYDPNAFESSPPSGGVTRTRRETPQSRLIAAASRGDLEAIGRTLSEPAPRLDLDHPLRLAAKHRHGAAVRLLIGRGASVSRAFSPNHAPNRLGKREQLVQFLSSCGIDAQFILELPRPRGPSPKSKVRSMDQMSVREAANRSRARIAAAKREAWAARLDALHLHRALKHHEGLLEEILESVRVNAEAGGSPERAVRAALAERGITDHKRRLSRAIVRKLYSEGCRSQPAGGAGIGEGV